MDELKCLRSMRGHAGPVTGCELMAGVPMTCSEDACIKVWDAGSPHPVVVMEAAAGVNAMAGSHTDCRLVAASWGLDIWDVGEHRGPTTPARSVDRCGTGVGGTGVP